MAILQRNMVTVEFLAEWLKSFIEPETSWKGAYTEEGQARAFHNGRNFLRSVLVIVLSENNLEEKEPLKNLIAEAVNTLAPY
jgi:hypothetical protein